MKTSVPVTLNSIPIVTIKEIRYTPDRCAHGKRLYGDDCDTCWDIEMTMYHCRRCDMESYYAADFNHRPDCPIKHIDIPNTPASYWRKLPAGHARKA